MEKDKNFKITDNLYICLSDKEETTLLTIEFLVRENLSEALVNGKILNINEIEKWIFFELVSGLLFNHSVSSEDLLKPFKNSKSKVPVKKQLQKAVHNLRNQLPELLGTDNDKKHELILTKRKTQFTDDTTYRLYLPDWEIKSFVKDIENISGLLSFTKQLIIFNNELYLKEIFKACNKIIELLKKEYSFYQPLLTKLEHSVKTLDLLRLTTPEPARIFSDLIENLETKFISRNSALLNEPVYKAAKPILGYYYGYNYATSGEDKISQNFQQIYIDENYKLKTKQISSDFKYIGNIRIEDNYLFTYAELIGENGFVQQVLNKPVVATTELKFLLGSFTAFSVDRKLCFGKRILVKIDHFIPLSECKTGYLNEESKLRISEYFMNCFENIREQIIKVKLPSGLDLDIKKLKVDYGRSLDIDWLNYNI